MSHLYQILEPRRLSEDFERDEFAGAGAPPPYLLAEEVKVLELGSGNAVFLDYMKKQSVDAVGVDVRPRGGKSHHK